MISKWNEGTRVRVVSNDETKGRLGKIHLPVYAAYLPFTAVVLDDDSEQAPAFYADDELEAE
ncbi:hypothetical protein ACIOJE_07535 [Kitasatospora sp. NPDC087861]|uniref:hypothetical protein n=1 Tax=Kitasatospora sp. NPDC087861 TaxID=3364070 RepID=UPI00380392F5